MIKERVITFAFVCLMSGIATVQLPAPVNASTSPSIIDVGITAKTTLPPDTFLRARPGDRFVAWCDIAYSGPMLMIQTKTTIIDPNGNELPDQLGESFLALMEDMPGHTGWIGDDFEISDTAILGIYDVKFSLLSQDGTQVYDSVIKSGWLELFSGDEPDIRTFTGSIDFSSVVVGTDKNGGKPIWNDGTATLAINSVQRTSGSADFIYIDPATPFEIPAGNSQFITIKFTPSSEGNKSAVFTINSNDPDEANITLSVSGSGITQTGIIEVTSDPSGFPFELTGPMDFGCPTPWSYDSAPLGTYTITWPPMSGYQAPPPETKTLMQGETITFHGDYSLIQETIGTPNKPSGPTSGTAGTSYTYITGGSSSSLEHEVEYLFDWGDGYYSDWSSEISASHAWTSPGTYMVKALARCGTHTDVLSSWSSGLTVSIDPVSLAIIDCHPSSFSFSAILGEDNPSNQMFSIKNSGGGNLNWSISYDTDWLNLSPISGTSTGEADIVAVSVSTFEMAAGSYSATITITAPDATNTPLAVPVNLTIEPRQVGDINVTSNPSGASFTLSGPTNYSGITPWSKTDAPAGSYTITWESIMGYTTPSSEKKTLTQGNIISFSGSYQSTLIPGRDIPQKSPGFFNDVLNSLGILPNSLAVEAFKTWTQYENTNAYWNPLATTRDMGEESWNYNDAGVKNYVDKETGIQATAETLRLYYYEAIRKMLAQESFDEQALRRALGTWSGLSADASYVINLVSEWRDIFQFPLKTIINVTSDPSGASFTLSGPADYKGTTPWSQADAPVGAYTVTWGFMSGHQTPVQETKTLMQDGEITFDGRYIPDEPFPGANSVTLSAYYAAWDKDLPPLSERAKIYATLGLGSTSEYTGTAEQNTRLLNVLKERQICPLTGVEVGWENPDLNIERLRENITRRLQQRLPYPDYLVSPWIAPDLADAYDELYQAGIDYDSLSLRLLFEAREFLNNGNYEMADKYYQRSNKILTMSSTSFSSAIEVFNGSLDASEKAARTIKELCEWTSTTGLTILNPAMGKAVEYIYSACDIAIDYSNEGLGAATRTFVSKAVIEVVFNQITYEKLGGRTIADYASNRVGKITFPFLETLFEDNEARQYIASKLMKELGSQITQEMAEQLISHMLEELESVIHYEAVKVESPVELRLYNSEGLITGLVDGTIKQEIPGTFYTAETITAFFPEDNYRYEIIGTEEGTYGLQIVSVKEEVKNVLHLTEISTSQGAIHDYILDWDVASEGGKGITMKIDSDGDGTFEEIKKFGQAGTVPSWVWIAVAGLCGLVGVFIGAFIVRRRMGGKQTA